MKIRSTILLVACVYVAVAGVEVFVHWYAGTQNTRAADSVKEWYLYRSEGNDKPIHAGLLDHIFPAVILGLAVGGVTARRPLREMVVCAFLLPLGMVALFPLYETFIPERDWETYWTSQTYGVRAIVFVPAYFKEVLLCLFFGAVGRNSIRWWKGLNQDATQEKA